MLYPRHMDRKRLSMLLLTVGLVFVFAWFGIDKFRNAFIWLGFLPAWMDGALGIPKETWLTIIGVSEVLMAVMVLIPVRRVRQLGALLMTVHLAGIITQVGWNDIGVRDIGLMLSAAALLVGL